MSCTTANGVSSYGPSQVSVSRMYSTCVSEWRVPLMKVTPETIGHAPWRADDLLGADAVEHRHDRRVREAAFERSRGSFEPRGLRRDDRDVERRQLVGIVGRRDSRAVLGLPADAKAVRVQRVGVFAASREHGDLAHASQMTREEAPDDARPDDADPFHAAPRVSQRGDMSVNRRARSLILRGAQRVRSELGVGRRGRASSSPRASPPRAARDSAPRARRARARRP